MEITIRRAEEKDIDQLVDIENRCFAAPWSRDAVRSDVVDNRIAIYLVAEEDHKVVGYCGMWAIVGEGHITNVAVLPEYRKWGVGSTLMEAIIDISQRMNLSGMTLEVRPSNVAAINLYHKYDFREEGRRVKYYEDNGEDALIMWRGKAYEG